MGIIFGTYDTIAVAGPLMVWWERRVEASNKAAATKQRDAATFSSRNPANSDRNRKGVGKPSRAA
jgi:hypothetical protein